MFDLQYFNFRYFVGLLHGMFTTNHMKTPFGKIIDFIKKEWFLLIMSATIALIVILFEVL